jgi:anaphase-promoting complex subunit 8
MIYQHAQQMDCPDAAPDVARIVLRRASRDLSDRGLLTASRWAAELLCALPAQPVPSTSAAPSALPAFATSTPNRPRSSLPGLPAELSINLQPGQSSPFGTGRVDLSSFAFSPEKNKDAASAATQFATAHDPLEEQEEDVYRLGKAYFDTREYERAANALKDCTAPRNRFVALYSKYMVGFAF